MAKGALAAGLQQKSGSATQLGLGIAQIGQNFGRTMERKMVREQQAQKEFTEKREAFKKDQQALYDGIAYEDQFEDTGLTDLDEAGQKFADTLRSEYELNNQMYEMGYIDEAEVRKRNARMKGQVKHLKEGVYGKMTAFKENYDKLQAEGKESEADSLKLQMMESMTKNISFGVDGAGNVEMRTPGGMADPSQASKVPIFKDSKIVGTGADRKIEIGETQYGTVSNKGTGSGVTRIPLSKFNDLLRNENGVDLDNVTSSITGLEGAGDIYRAGSREYTRYTGFGEEGGRELSKQQDQLMGTAIAGMSQTEKIDALSRLGGVYTDPAEYEKLTANEKKDAMLVDPSAVMGYGVEVEKEIDDRLKRGLNNKLMNELVAKESSKPYDDPLKRAAQLKEINKKPLTKSAKELRRYGDRDKDRLVTAHYPTGSDGIKMDFIVNAADTPEISRQLFSDLEAQVGVPMSEANMIDALTNIKYQGDMVDVETGYTEVEFGMEMNVPIYEKDDKGVIVTDDNGKPVQRMIYDERVGKDVPAFEKKPVLFKYKPLTLSDYNKIITKTGRDPISDKDWQKILDARQKDKIENGKYSSYSPNKQ